jgi:hypothetical protein
MGTPPLTLTFSNASKSGSFPPLGTLRNGRDCERRSRAGRGIRLFQPRHALCVRLRRCRDAAQSESGAKGPHSGGHEHVRLPGRRGVRHASRLAGRALQTVGRSSNDDLNLNCRRGANSPRREFASGAPTKTRLASFASSQVSNSARFDRDACPTKENRLFSSATITVPVPA